VRGPMLYAAIAWTVMITNPLHGQLLTPVIGDHNVHHWAWWALVPVGYVLVSGSFCLYALLGWSTSNHAIRRNAFLMAGGLLVTLVFNFLSYVVPLPVPFDLTVVGLGAASAIFLYGAYRTELFSLLPVAVVEATRHDPSGLILVDLEGRWLRSNPAAEKLLGPSLEQPGSDVVSLLVQRFRTAHDKPIDRDDLARRILQGPRAHHAVVGPLCGGDGDWVEITATPIPRSEGRARAVSLRIQDVSERVAVEEQLRRARRELANEAAERREVDALLGEILCDLARASALDDPRQVRRVLQRARRAAEQARIFSGAVVPEPLGERAERRR
jgi:PAS domain S-box-containing protein